MSPTNKTFWLSLITFLGFASVAFVWPFSIYLWDIALTRALQFLPSAVMEPLMRLISAPGYFFGPFLLFSAFLVLWLLRTRLRAEAYTLGLSVGLNILFSPPLKKLLHRPRPSDALVHLFVRERGYSFPSGHVLTYVGLFGCMYMILNRLPPTPARKVAKVFCAVMVIGVGPSRVYLGAHWTSDVIASYAMGFAIVSGLWWSIRALLGQVKPTLENQGSGGFV